MMDIVNAHRRIDADFIEALEALAASPTPNWWRDVLAESELFIAVRRNSLNVYYRGASIFKIDWNGGRIIPSTHAKYLVRQTQTYVPLINGQFQHPASALTWDRYEGVETLRQMMRTATLFAGPEKSGLHPLLVGDPAIIDAEIALTREAPEEGDSQQQDRLDAAVVRSSSAGPEIVFCEAKHFINPALRANGENLPAAFKQIDGYEKALNRYAQSLANGYVEVAKAFVRIHAMRGIVRNGDAPKLHDLIRLIAENGTPPIIDTKPHLLIFGFDKAQRDDPAWKNHLKKLEDTLGRRVRAIGNPTRQSVALR